MSEIVFAIDLSSTLPDIVSTIPEPWSESMVAQVIYGMTVMVSIDSHAPFMVGAASALASDMTVVNVTYEPSIEKAGKVLFPILWGMLTDKPVMVCAIGMHSPEMIQARREGSSSVVSGGVEMIPEMVSVVGE